jgi:hypothetical protein
MLRVGTAEPRSAPDRGLRCSLRPVTASVYAGHAVMLGGASPLSRWARRTGWRASDAEAEGIVEADLQASWGRLDHGKLMPLMAEPVADGRVHTRSARRRTVGSRQHGRFCPPLPGTPPGGVGSPVLSSMLLTPCERAMCWRGAPRTR